MDTPVRESLGLFECSPRPDRSGKRFRSRSCFSHNQGSLLLWTTMYKLCLIPCRVLATFLQIHIFFLTFVIDVFLDIVSSSCRNLKSFLRNVDRDLELFANNPIEGALSCFRTCCFLKWLPFCNGRPPQL
eukprot:Blabericola_migrator_1__9732@NODE_532_length_7786_cov_102_495531_g405_i0_p8_GENE_NODE_532_length_7786_cov_102_495531_g405_i0NODE_532_length_7786_cov_102_495531_g405_i0_p8_ORF_typecomplete_len130_score1_07_NODE_532_length_7786_cov_102_495531_g405_i039684357